MLTVLVVIASALVIMLIAAVLNRRRAWSLQKRDHEARCQLWSPQSGFELHVKHGM